VYDISTYCIDYRRAARMYKAEYQRQHLHRVAAVKKLRRGGSLLQYNLMLTDYAIYRLVVLWHITNEL